MIAQEPGTTDPREEKKADQGALHQKETKEIANPHNTIGDPTKKPA
jgi:hypothetical protein